MPGTLYVVATPIGNLEDVTLRALKILRGVSVIAAEDTRRTSRLLQHYSISTPTTSLHEHNERSKTPALIRQLMAGESIALVSDAGTPVVSDPGARLIAEAHAAGVRVEPIPGASAAMAALSASGFGGDAFVFLGFPPARAAARRRWLADAARDTANRTLILFEAPHRIRETLTEMLESFGDRVIAIGRELTKAHEEMVVAPISAHLRSIDKGRGEYTLVVAPAEAPAEVAAPRTDQLFDEFSQLTSTGDVTRRSAIKQLAIKYGLTAKDVYSRVEQGRNSVVRPN
jgi:16S rRNA (cytidine1402-2'-O)-methyltransferase